MRSFNASLGSVLLGVSIITIALGLLLRLRLSTKHSAYWRGLGSPPLRSWLWRNGYDNLTDSVTVGLARLVKSLGIVFFAGVAVSLLLNAMSR